jgi:hypothetical protein
VSPGLLKGRFTFASFAGSARPADPWSVLDLELGPDVIPAVADQSVITWGLGLKPGDELEYRDESGRQFRVRLMAGLDNSLFQGSLLVPERSLSERFPSVSGHRMLLVEAPESSRAKATSRLSRSLARLGPALTPAPARLAEFNSVEGAYLAVFSLLGWLGMLLGTLGLAVVVVRNVAESRGEIALLRAVGLGRRAILRLLLAEHMLPVAAGTAAGLLSSALAIAPTGAQSAGASLPALLIPVLAVFACALACIAAAAAFALRADLLPALKNE